MKKEGAMKGRMALFVIAILICQLSCPYLTGASAADQNGVASVYSTPWKAAVEPQAVKN
jgi:hypothetical protein